MEGEPKSFDIQASSKGSLGLEAKRFDYGAAVFVAVVIFSLISIGFLARNIFAAAQHLETAKRNGEMIAHLLAEIGTKRKIEKSAFSSCQKDSRSINKLTWGPCWDEIANFPEVSRLVNPIEPNNGVFGSACDGSDESIGRIVIERGTPWFSAGMTGVTFAPSDAGDVISSEVPMRVQVCNRWGEGVKVLEFKF